MSGARYLAGAARFVNFVACSIVEATVESKDLARKRIVNVRFPSSIFYLKRLNLLGCLAKRTQMVAGLNISRPLRDL